MFDDLYQEIILDHSRRPQHRGALGEEASHTHLHNPFCGDDIHLWLEFDGERVKKIRFSGMGCLISQAAASMMSELIEGKSVSEAEQVSQDFHKLLHGAEEQARSERIGDLVALGGVRRVPARIRCALLAFESAGAAAGPESRRTQ